MGGWKAMSRLSCSRGLGPGPSAGGSATVRNGLAGPAMSPKKKAVTTNMASMAQATRGSVSRARNFQVTATR